MTELVTVEVMHDEVSFEEEFDYGMISDPINREWAESAAGFITFGLGQAVVKVLEAGNLLIEAKQRLPHGEYLPWVQQACKLKQSHAQKLVKAAEWVNAEHVQHLNQITDTATLFLLSADATPEEVRQWALERCAKGDPPSRAEVAARKRKAQGKPDRTLLKEALSALRLSPEARDLASKAEHISTRQLMDALNVDELPKGKQHVADGSTYCKNGSGWWKFPFEEETPVEPFVMPQQELPIGLTFDLMPLERAAGILGISVASLRVRLTPGQVEKKGAYVRNGFQVSREGKGLVRLHPI